MHLFTFFSRPSTGLKSLILLIGVLLGINGVKGQLATWPLSSDGVATGVAANVTAGTFIAGSGIVNLAFANNGATGGNWPTGALSVDDYFQITIAPNVGYELNITALNFGERRGANGIRDYQVQWSIDGFTTNTTIATVNVPDDTDPRTGDISSLSINVANGQTLSIRLYGYNSEASGGTWRINDGMNIVGTVTASCIPSTQTTSMSTNTIATTSSNYAFTRGNGTAGAIVVARATTTAAVAPTSGTVYTPSTTGSFTGTTTTGTGNIVIFNGTAAGANTATGNLTITNLTAATQYTLTAYEYNATSNCYNINSAATTSFYTLCDVPTINAATLVGSSSMTLNWAAVTGAGSYLLDVSTANDFSSFVTGYNNLSVAGTSRSVTGLSPSTTYYYRVRAVNAASAASANSTTESQATIAAATQYVLVGVPATGSSGAGLPAFTVEARNGSNVLDVSYTGTITINKVAGSGALSGTAAAVASGGVSTFNNIILTGADTYTINATGTTASGSTTSATSGNIVVSVANATGNVWSGTGSAAAWLSTSNWANSSIPTGTENAQFGATTSSDNTVGIDMTTVSNNQAVGAIEFTSARANPMTIGNSSASGNGVLTLNGVVVDGVANVILRNNSNQLLTIQNTNTGSGAQTMGVALGNATANVVNVAGAGNIVISSIVSGSSRQLTFNSSSSGSLILSGANTYTGGTIINGTSTGRLRLDAPNAIPTTGTVRINTGGALRFNVSGGYGNNNATQILELNPNQTANASLDVGFTTNNNATWRGIVNFMADTRIAIESANAGTRITFAGNATGAGTLIKSGFGNLILAGTANTLTGRTVMNNGTLTVNSGSSMGTGTLSMAQTSTSATSVALNNATQSIGGLSSTWTATTGTIAQTITLNGTALSVNQSTNTTYGTGAVATLTSTIAGTGSLVKTGAGILTLTGSNTFTGSTTITSGEIRLNPSANATFASQIILNGGILSTNSITATRTFTSSSTLNLNANSTIALGTGNHSLIFANSSAVTWNGSTLTITGWTGTAGISGTNGKIFFGANNSGLTASQLAKVSFTGYNAGATLLSTGELVPFNAVITGAATTAVFTSTYGSNSGVQTFTIGGSSLVADITATAPNSNFEVASDGVNYGTTATFTQTNGVVNSAILSIRLAATAVLDGSYNSQNIVLSSTNATSVNITTPSTGNGVRATTLVLTGSTVCPSATGSVTSDGSLAGVSYQLFNTGGTPIQAPQSAVNGDPITWTGLSSNVNYYVVGTSPAASSNLTSANSESVLVGAYAQYTWIGGADNDQTNSANWQCGAPDANAFVNVTLAGDMTIESNFQVADLTIPSGYIVTVSDVLKISGSLVGDNGAIDATAGTVVFNKVSDNVIQGNVFFNNTIHNLQIEGDASFDGAINLTGELSIVGNNIELNADESLTLISNETGTARIADLTAGGTQTGNSVTGIVNAQRYIPLNTLEATRTGRAWRLMSIPLEGNSILNTVRLAFAGTAPNANANNEASSGTGTLISGPGNLNTSGAAAAARGFDYWTGLNIGTASSIRRFTTTSTGAGWTETPMDIHTTLLDNAEQGYMLFIRGDRGIRNVNDPLQTQPASATQFQTVGTLKQGNKTVTIPAFSTATAFAVLGNPYFAPLNFESVGNDGDNNGIIKPNQFYLWDANMPGTNGNGGYRLITKLSAGVWEDASDATFTGSNPDLELIQPWQAIIVIPDAGGTLTIKEQHKQGNPGSAPQPFDPIVAAPQPWLRAGLYYNEAKASSRIDGTAVAFGVNDTLQVAAINPFGSSLSINMRKAGNTLKAEKRGFFQTTDTVHFVTNGLTARKFVLQLQADALVQPGGTVELVDKYTNTRTTLLPGTTTDYVFTPVAGNAASMAADRLMVVLRQPVFVLATFVNVSATTANNGHLINWTTTNEQHIKRYEVEYSSNGTQFAKLENKNALKGNTNNYQHTVANPAVADAYYRIKAIGYNGDVQYSNRVWLKEASISGSEVKLYPNPVKGQQVNIELSRLAQGNYQIVLVNAVGQQVMSRIVSHIGGTATQTLPTGSLSAGLYELQVYQNDTLVARQKMSVAVGK